MKKKIYIQLRYNDKCIMLVTTFGLQSKSSRIGNPAMTIVPGLNQYFDYYLIFVPAGYDHNYVSILIKNLRKIHFALIARS